MEYIHGTLAEIDKIRKDLDAETVNALVCHAGIDEIKARIIVDSINKGDIPNVRINY